MSLRAKRAERLVDSLNSTARKVYDATPIAEPWSLTQIVGELVRTGKSLSFQGVHGSLRHMTEIGLVKEVRHKHYQQVPIIRDGQQQEEEETMSSINATLSVTKKPEQTPFERIEQKVNTLIDTANSLQHLAQSINEELMDLQIKQEEETKKYQKIAELLDAIGSLKK